MLEDLRQWLMIKGYWTGMQDLRAWLSYRIVGHTCINCRGKLGYIDWSDTPIGPVCSSVCYDVKFPNWLYKSDWLYE